MNGWLSISEFAKREQIPKRTVQWRIKHGKYPQEKIKTVPGQGPKRQKTLLHYSLLSDSAPESLDPHDALTVRQQTPMAPGVTTSTRSQPGGRHAAGEDACAPKEPTPTPPRRGLAPDDFLLTPKEFGQLAGLTAGYVRRKYRGLVGESEKVLQEDGTYRIHAHLLPDQALLHFYQERGAAVPQYLRDRLCDALEDVPQQERERAYLWTDLLNQFEVYFLSLKNAGGDACAPRSKLPTAAKAFCQSFAGDERVTPLVLSGAKLLRQRRKYRKHGVRGLVSKPRKIGIRADISEQALSFLYKHYLHQIPGKKNRTLSAEMTIIKAKREGWIVPDKRTLIRYLEQIPPMVEILYTEGEKAFADKALPSALRAYEFPAMFCWVSDHHQFDVMVALPNGKTCFPWITAWMDMRSRKLMGWQIVEQPNSESICLALHQGIIRYGIPKHALTDNGKDYTCKRITGGKTTFKKFKSLSQGDRSRLIGIFEALQINPHFAIPYNAKSKPIERMFRTHEERFCCQLPGYRGSHVKERPEKLKKEEAEGLLLPLADFAGIVNQYIEERYHTHTHRGKGMNGRSPNQCFVEERVEAGYATDEHLQLLLLKLATNDGKRTVKRNGIEVFPGQWYRSQEIQQQYLGQNVRVRYVADDLSQVYIYDLEDRRIGEAPVVEHTQIFDDEEAIKKLRSEQKAYRKAAKTWEEEQTKAYQRKIGLYDRVGLDETAPAPEYKEDRGRGAEVTRLVLNQTGQSKKAVPSPATEKDDIDVQEVIRRTAEIWAQENVEAQAEADRWERWKEEEERRVWEETQREIAERTNEEDEEEDIAWNY